jgi:hypothetical protein
MTTDEREELVALRMERRVLREVRDILKRATAFSPSALPTEYVEVQQIEHRIFSFITINCNCRGRALAYPCATYLGHVGQHQTQPLEASQGKL